MKLVFDTNVLIDGFADDFSASARLIDAVQDGEVQAFVSNPTRREYELLVNRRIPDEKYKNKIQDFISSCHEVTPTHVDVVIDDKEDKKFIEAAVSAHADYIVSSDRHLLDIGEVGDIKIVTPEEAWNKFREESGQSEWTEWASNLGI